MRASIACIQLVQAAEHINTKLTPSQCVFSRVISTQGYSAAPCGHVLELFVTAACLSLLDLLLDGCGIILDNWDMLELGHGFRLAINLTTRMVGASRRQAPW